MFNYIHLLSSCHDSNVAYNMHVLLKFNSNYDYRIMSSPLQWRRVFDSMFFCKTHINTNYENNFDTFFLYFLTCRFMSSYYLSKFYIKKSDIISRYTNWTYTILHKMVFIFKYILAEIKLFSFAVQSRQVFCKSNKGYLKLIASIYCWLNPDANIHEWESMLISKRYT